MLAALDDHPIGGQGRRARLQAGASPRPCATQALGWPRQALLRPRRASWPDYHVMCLAGDLADHMAGAFMQMAEGRKSMLAVDRQGADTDSGAALLLHKGIVSAPADTRPAYATAANAFPTCCGPKPRPSTTLPPGETAPGRRAISPPAGAATPSGTGAHESATRMAALTKIAKPSNRARRRGQPGPPPMRLNRARKPNSTPCEDKIAFCGNFHLPPTNSA